MEVVRSGKRVGEERDTPHMLCVYFCDNTAKAEDCERVSESSTKKSYTYTCKKRFFSSSPKPLR